MFLHVHQPGPPLGRFVELVTYYADYWPDHAMQKLLPDGAVEIIVDLTDTPKHLYECEDRSRARTFRRAWISGMRRKWILIEAAPGSSMVVIRFRPGGAYPFLGFDVDGITDVVDELDDVLANVTASLRDRVLSASTVEAKMQAVERWLLGRARRGLEPNPVIEYLTGRLFAPAGIRISDVVAEVGYSQRHVLGQFRRWVGLTPKSYSRVRRFQQVLQTVTRAAAVDPIASAELRAAPPPDPDWVGVALDHGYYDQSHLVHDFQDFSGLSPGQYIAAYRGLENYLPMD